jgi:hypothetical protein
MTALQELAARWREQADTLDRWQDSRGAALLRQAATELLDAIEEAGDEELNLEAAARESGYSDRRLRELIAEGAIPNAGRKGAPRVRRRDLPKKARSASSYDAEADALSLLRRSKGSR